MNEIRKINHQLEFLKNKSLILEQFVESIIFKARDNGISLYLKQNNLVIDNLIEYVSNLYVNMEDLYKYSYSVEFNNNSRVYNIFFDKFEIRDNIEYKYSLTVNIFNEDGEHVVKFDYTIDTTNQ